MALKRPLILWGVDSVSQRIITGLGEQLEASATRENGLHVFRPAQDTREDFRHFLATVESAAKSGNLQPEPVVVLFAASFLPEADAGLDLLTQVSRILKSSLSGSQSIQCVVFVPPSNATTNEMLQAYRFFLRLEDILGNEPFLNMVFVNQLPLELYEASSITPDRLLKNDEIQELLSRQLLDLELQTHITGPGYQAIGNRNTIKGKKCAYSTLGSYRLVYEAQVCFRYLIARFQHECFHEGLWNIEGVDEYELKKIQARVDGYIENHLSSLSHNLPSTPTLSDELRYLSTEAENQSEGSQIFLKELRRLMDETTSPLEPLIDSLDGCIKKELMEFFQTTPNYLAGATLLVRAFGGTRLLPDRPHDMRSPSGIWHFDYDFCLRPFQQSLDAWMVSHWPAALVQSPIPQKREKDTWETWVTNSLDLLREAMPDLALGPRCVVTFYRALMTFALTYIGTPSRGPLRSAVDLTQGLASELQSAENSIREFVRHNQADQAQVSQAIEDLKNKYRWYQRWLTQRWQYLEERGQLEQSLQELAAALEGLEAGSQQMHEVFVGLINDVVLPYCVRSLVSHKLYEEIQATTRELDGFVTIVKQSVEANWSEARIIPETNTSIEATVLTTPKLEILYQRILHRKPMTEFADKVLAFFPKFQDERDKKALPYRDCQHLGDHYREGPRSLLVRLADYTRDLFAPIGDLDILDILELEGRDASVADVNRAVQKSQAFLNLTQGMMSMVKDEKLMNEMIVIRNHDRGCSRLRTDYEQVFQPNYEFRDSQNPHVIHLISLKFGLPAFLIRVLQEGRKHHHAQPQLNPMDIPASTAIDLWPD